MNRKLWFTIRSVLILSLVSSVPVYAAGGAFDKEVREGQKAAQKLEQQIKLTKDEAIQQRVDAIGAKLADIAKTTRVPAIYGSDALGDFNYTFKIVDDKEVNAFSLPGGIIYINKGLIDKVESDDELAGVMAHEIAHSAHHHMAFLERKESKYTTKMLIATAIGMLISNGHGSEMSQLLMTAPLISIARLNSYGREAERDSDITAVSYMVDAGYNPVGLLTFMEKISKEHTFAYDRLGIYATHPPYNERAASVTEELNRRKIHINRRDVSGLLAVTVKEADLNGKTLPQVFIEGKPVYAPAASDGLSAFQRADSIADKLDKALDSGPITRDVKVSPDGQSLLIKGVVVITFRPKDAELAGMSLQELAAKTRSCINRPLYNTWLASECMLR